MTYKQQMFSYIHYANNDYRVAEFLRKNKVSLYSQIEHYVSASEKYLKQIAYDSIGPGSGILYTHNVAKIVAWLLDIVDIPVKKSDMYWMTELCHNSRYPLNPGTKPSSCVKL